jgi:hypothetical protein
VLVLFDSVDTSLKDGLFHEFKKFGKVTSVQIHGASEERYGLVFFRQQEDQEKALTASKGKLFFGMQIEVTAWVGPGETAELTFIQSSMPPTSVCEWYLGLGTVCFHFLIYWPNVLVFKGWGTELCFCHGETRTF